MSPYWITVGITVAMLVALGVLLLRDRLAPFEVVVRGNSATQREAPLRAEAVAFTRWGARRYARTLNSGPTGTAIFKAEVRRRVR